MKEKLKICLIGTGNIGKTHMEAYVKFKDRVQISICDKDKRKLRRFADKYNIEECFDDYQNALKQEDISAVDICLPHHLHAPVAIEAARRGKHILLEKPIAGSIKEADDIIGEARKSKVKLAISENFRFEPSLIKAKELIDNGVIGDPFLILVNEWWNTIDVVNVVPAFNWRREKDKCEGGILLDRGVHLMAMLNLLGGKVESVYAKCARPFKSWQGDDTSIVILKFENSILANLVESWGFRATPKMPLVSIYGTQGSIIDCPDKRLPPHKAYEIGGLYVYSAKITRYQSEVKKEDIDYMKNWTLDIWPDCEIDTKIIQQSLCKGVLLEMEKEYPGYNVYEKSIENFINCILTGAEPRVRGEDARSDIELVISAYESSRTGKEVKL